MVVHRKCATMKWKLSQHMRLQYTKGNHYQHNEIEHITLKDTWLWFISTSIHLLFITKLQMSGTQHYWLQRSECFTSSCKHVCYKIANVVHNTNTKEYILDAHVSQLHELAVPQPASQHTDPMLPYQSHGDIWTIALQANWNQHWPHAMYHHNNIMSSHWNSKRPSADSQEASCLNFLDVGWITFFFVNIIR